MTAMAMAQANAASSRAMATVTTLVGFAGPLEAAIAGTEPDLRLPGDRAGCVYGCTRTQTAAAKMAVAGWRCGVDRTKNAAR